MEGDIEISSATVLEWDNHGHRVRVIGPDSRVIVDSSARKGEVLLAPGSYTVDADGSISLSTRLH
jgi:hypothetical protein